MNSKKLRVFIGSSMTELRDVRDIVHEVLKERGIAAFVYENEAGAQPQTVVETSLRELRDCDVFVGIFWQRYPRVSTEEFKEARNQGKPCFIYIRDKDIEREAALERFLHEEVYHPEKGVSYDFFDGSMTLAQRIGDDVLAWLVREVRELTAEVASQRVSKDELTKLQREIERLQSVTLQTLPRGTVVDRLARDLRGWFSALGYGIEREIKRSNENFEWIINIPERRGYTRVLVRGIEGEAELRDLGIAESSLERERADEAWLVSIRRVSQAVRSAVGKQSQLRVFAYTFDELLDENADFSRYFDWLEGEIQRRGIDKAYVQLGAKKDEFESEGGKYLGQANYGRENGWLDGYIDRWIGDPSKEHVSMLGEFGTGKTHFTLHYAWTALQRSPGTRPSNS